jgi:hypothetical protein
MVCRNQSDFSNSQLSLRSAVSCSCRFLDVLTGRRALPDTERLATERGWNALVHVRRRIGFSPARTRILQVTAPSPDTAEVVAVIETDRGAAQQIVLALRATVGGWRLDDCALMRAGYIGKHIRPF